MARLSPKLEALCDLRKDYYSWRRGGHWHGDPTLTVGRAKEICEAGRVATGLVGMSKVNKALTLEQAYGILSKCGNSKEDSEPLHFLAAKNVLREFGRFYTPAPEENGSAEINTQQPHGASGVAK